MQYSHRATSDRKLMAACWWMLFIISLAFAGFALQMLLLELNASSGAEMVAEAKNREAPIAFMLHALFGGMGLVAGALQFNSTIRRWNIRVHRTIGWIYLLAIWGASSTGIWNAFYFAVPDTAKAIFVVVGAWWFTSTSLGYWQIRQRAVGAHRRWMIRSYAISLFIVTFPVWVPAMQMISVDAVAWPIGLLLAASLNAIAAELWIRNRSNDHKNSSPQR